MYRVRTGMSTLLAQRVYTGCCSAYTISVVSWGLLIHVGHLSVRFGEGK